MIESAPQIAFALALAASVVAPPELHLGWNALPEAPDHYEVQVATNLAQFVQPVMGTFVFTGQSIETTDTNLPIYLDAPQRFYRVRAWIGIECSDWGRCVSTNNQPLQ